MEPCTLTLTEDQSRELGTALWEARGGQDWDEAHEQSCIADVDLTDGSIGTYYVAGQTVNGVKLYTWVLYDSDFTVLDEAEHCWLDAGHAELSIPDYDVITHTCDDDCRSNGCPHS